MLINTLWVARRAALSTVAAGAVLVAGEAAYVRKKFHLPPDARGPLSGVCEPPGHGIHSSASAPPQRHIVFLGDSLVTGVGCSAEASLEGPVLPRQTAQVLAKELGQPVSWSCLGETGADVTMVRTRLLPRLHDEAQRVSDGGHQIDAVIVITGLNDIKECLLFANPRLHPWNFEKLMESLLWSIREVTGPHCSLLVAGCPIEAVPRFNDIWPLSLAVRFVAQLWENRKKSATDAARCRSNDTGIAEGVIQFVVPPPRTVQRMLDGAAYFASDGMHPNDAGYVVMGELLAGEILANWRPGRTT